MTSLDFKSNPLDFGDYWLFYLFHIFYFLAFGPFIYVFFLFTPRMRNLIHNMQILRVAFKSVFNILPLFCILMIIIKGSEFEWTDEMYMVLLYNIIMIHLIKIAIVASKYATMGFDKMQQMMLRRMTIGELDGEHMLYSWADQTPLQIYKHINSAMNKFEYDDSNFVISFMKEPTKKTIELLKQAEIIEAQFNGAVSDRLNQTQEEFSQLVGE